MLAYRGATSQFSVIDDYADDAGDRDDDDDVDDDGVVDYNG